MPSVLGYWKQRAFGQGIRLMLEYVGEDYEEKLYVHGPAPGFSKECWFEEKFSLGLDFPNVPYYKDDQVNISQSHAILRYLNKKYKMEPKSQEEEVRQWVADEQIKDFRMALANLCFNVAGGDLEEAKKEFTTNLLPAKLKEWETFLGDRRWLAGNNISYVDFAFYSYLEMHSHLDQNYLKQFPKLTAYVERFENLTPIKKYLESDRFIRAPIFSPRASLLNVR